MNTPHPTEWHKIAAILLYKLGDSATITMDDISAVENKLGHDPVIVTHHSDKGLDLRLMTSDDATKLAGELGTEVEWHE